MDFPVYLGPFHPHRVFDLLAFFVGGQIFWWQLRRPGALALTTDQKWALAAGCVVGAALGAKLLVLLEDPAFTLAHWRDPFFWATGKTIVGGLLGGLVGVEWAKRGAGIERRTGDAFVVPLAVGLAVGRVGCFLSGLQDDAYGVPTALPWGVDFGDGPRHPTQLYEVAFALAFLAALPALRRRFPVEGDVFRLFLGGYLAFRFLEEFVRESARWGGVVTVYQVAALAGVAWVLADRGFRARLRRRAQAAPA